MKTLSIIIPSLRPNKLIQCVEAIKQNTVDVDYEIIVVSPHRVIGSKIIWIEDDRACGVNYATNLGYDHASGVFVTTLSDEALVRKDWAKNMIDFVKEQEFVNDRVIGNFRVCDVHEQPVYTYYGRPFSIFPFLRRDLADELGGLFDRRYVSFYHDPDLALRCYDNGGTVATCPNAWIYHPYINDDIHKASVLRSEAQDKAKFEERWRHLGKFQYKEVSLADISH